VIGEIFDRVYVEGSFDLVNRNVQSTAIPSGGATGVEFKVDYPGDYVIVDHSIFRVHKGAAGMLQVGGTPDETIYQPIKYSTQLSGGH
jgi:nitrite reductase (NO-forming)